MAFVGMYCICGEPYEINKFMIQCDVCKDWLHGSCVGLKEYMSTDLDRYHCPRCEPTYGASVYKPQTNWHRHNYSEPDAENKPVQTGTAVFIKELKTRHFPSADPVLVRLRGHQLTLPYLYQHGFDAPILVEEKEGLEMVLPPENFSVKDVETCIGSEREVDVIDVTRQSDIRMKLGEFVEYYMTPPEQRTRILNIISLEFSHTQLSQLVEAPYIARKLDWVNFVWPKDLPDDTEFQKPEVQKYCLMGVQDSYTDFHVDFGGSSVWYHLLKGEKIFYLIKPTPANLSLYQRWMTSSSQSETFFGDQVDMCYKCVMKQGETMLIPTGWIHAVLTPTDSLVFGGNFLHSLNIPMQLQVYEIEKKIRTPEKFRFPAFEATNWYAAKTLTEDIRHMNEMGTKCPNHVLQGAKALIFTLKQWNQDKDFNKSRREQVPLSINGQKLLKDLGKEVRHAERYLNSLNPPKPERESKRKKKKPVNKDFVDFSQAQVFEETNEAKEPLKLTLKTVNRSHHISTTSSPSSPVPRPPLKLTLPKPAMYPYSTSALSNGRNNSSADKLEATNPVLTENIDKTRRSWAESQPHVKFKSEELKIKTSKTDCSVFIDETKAMLKSATVLRFKLGAKDTGINLNDSVYDFHDESDEDRLMIDEMPKKRKHNLITEPFAALKMKFASNSLTHKLDSNFDLEVAGEVDVVSDVPKNGIEELLKASGYTAESAEPNPRLEEIEPGRASPSTREAIAGMLSISRAFMPEHGSKDEISSSRLRRKRMQFSDDYGENIDKVHQDDDYIYPALDASDDEDLVFKPRGKRKLDEAWNPKARLGPLTPKTDRPTREGTKKQAVEKGLEAAAAKRAGMPLPKRPYNRKKPKLTVEPQAASSSAASSAASSSVGTSNMKKMDVKFRKPKKGMATAKQRLGKILKIHKMKF